MAELLFQPEKQRIRSEWDEGMKRGEKMQRDDVDGIFSLLS